MGAAAAALLGDDARDVARAVAHERAALAGERGKHELAVGAVGHGLERVRIDDLGIEVVLGHMQAVCRFAFHGHARSHDLGQTVHVAVLHAELAADVVAHRLGGGLGAEDHAGDREVIGGVVAHLDSGVSDVERVGRGARENVGFEVLHHLHLALGVAGGRRDDGTADGLAARMRAQTAREQAVAVGHLDGGVPRAAHHVDAAGEAVAPVLEVVLGMAHHRRLAGGARGRVDARHIVLADGEQTERVGVAHILLDDERELDEIVERLEIVGSDARLGERLTVELHVVVGMADGLLHALELQLTQLLDGHRLDFRLVVHGHLPLPCCHFGRCGRVAPALAAISRRRPRCRLHRRPRGRRGP